MGLGRATVVVLVVGLAPACSLESAALGPPPATMDASTDSRVEDGGMGDVTLDGAPSDGASPDADADADAEVPFVLAYELTPGSTTCPMDWEYAGFADSCLESRDGCGDAQASLFIDPPVSPWQEIRGFVRGLQGQTPDAFPSDASGLSIGDVYVDGVSITTEDPREHIWTFAAGLNKPTSPSGNSCPCDMGPPPPPFVGDQWTCETGNDTNDFMNTGPIYLSDVLWDADGDAHGAGCARVRDPGWFEARLAAPTTARIEVRIMADSCDDKVSITELRLEVR